MWKTRSLTFQKDGEHEDFGSAFVEFRGDFEQRGDGGIVRLIALQRRNRNVVIDNGLKVERNLASPPQIRGFRECRCRLVPVQRIEVRKVGGAALSRDLHAPDLVDRNVYVEANASV